VQRPKNGSDVTGFGSFDNSMCRRVLNLLEPCDLRLGNVMIESCSSQAWKWKWWKLLWNQGMDGYCEADEYGNSRIWKWMRSGQQR